MCQPNQAARCSAEIFYPVYLEVCFTYPHCRSMLTCVFQIPRFDDQTHFICRFSGDGSIIRIWDIHIRDSQSTITLRDANRRLGVYGSFVYVTLLFLYHVKHVSLVANAFKDYANIVSLLVLMRLSSAMRSI